MNIINFKNKQSNTKRNGMAQKDKLQLKSIIETKTDIDHGMHTSSNHILSQAGLKHLKFEMKEGEYIVTLIDQFEYEIIKGYGKSIVDAINDMHSNLI